jgi:hypothetical protein
MQSKTTYLIVRLGIGLSMFGHGWFAYQTEAFEMTA